MDGFVHRYVLIAVCIAVQRPHLVVSWMADIALLLFKSFAGKYRSQNVADGGCVNWSTAFPLPWVVVRHWLLGLLPDILLQCQLEEGRRFQGQNMGIDDNVLLEKKNLKGASTISWIYSCRIYFQGTLLALLYVFQYLWYVNVCFSKFCYCIWKFIAHKYSSYIQLPLWRPLHTKTVKWEQSWS